MREEVLSSVGAQIMDTSECHLSERDGVEIYCEDAQLAVDQNCI